MNSDFVTEYILKTKNFQDRYPKFVKLLEIYSAIYRKTQTSIIILDDDDDDSGKSIPSYGIFPVDHYPSNKSSMLEYTCFIEFESISLKFKLNIVCVCVWPKLLPCIVSLRIVGVYFDFL